jgi:hypothetical protein
LDLLWSGAWILHRVHLQSGPEDDVVGVLHRSGLRPTYARYPNGGIMPLTDDKFDQIGAVARRVEDLLLFDTVLTRDSRTARCDR